MDELSIQEEGSRPPSPEELEALAAVVRDRVLLVDREEIYLSWSPEKRPSREKLSIEAQGRALEAGEAVKVHKTSISALVTGRGSRPSRKGLRALWRALEQDPKELDGLVEKRMRDAPRVPRAFKNDEAHAIVGAGTPSSLVLEWGLSGAIPITRADLGGKDPIDKRSTIQGALYIRPLKLSLLELLGWSPPGSRASKFRHEAPFKFIEKQQAQIAQTLLQSRSGPAEQRRLLWLRGWEFIVQPNFCIFAHEPRTDPSPASELALLCRREGSFEKALGAITERLHGKRIIVQSGTVAERAAAEVMKALGLEVIHVERDGWHAWSNKEKCVGIVPSVRSAADFRLLSQGVLDEQCLVVGSAAQYWSWKRVSNVNLLMSELDLAPPEKVPDRLKNERRFAGELDPEGCEAWRSTELGRYLFDGWPDERGILCLREGDVPHAELPQYAKFFTAIARGIKERWKLQGSRRKIVEAVSDLAFTYGLEGDGIQEDFIDKGMWLQISKRPHELAFVPLERDHKNPKTFDWLVKTRWSGEPIDRGTQGR